jgi:hypothetical protein
MKPPRHDPPCSECGAVLRQQRPDCRCAACGEAYVPRTGGLSPGEAEAGLRKLGLTAELARQRVQAATAAGIANPGEFLAHCLSGG